MIDLEKFLVKCKAAIAKTIGPCPIHILTDGVELQKVVAEIERENAELYNLPKDLVEGHADMLTKWHEALSEAEKLRAENAELRQVLVEAAIPLEVLNGAADMSQVLPRLRDSVSKATKLVRETLFAKARGQRHD